MARIGLINFQIFPFTPLVLCEGVVTDQHSAVSIGLSMMSVAYVVEACVCRYRARMFLLGTTVVNTFLPSFLRSFANLSTVPGNLQVLTS
jgi:hypothetical protein